MFNVVDNMLDVTVYSIRRVVKKTAFLIWKFCCIYDGRKFASVKMEYIIFLMISKVACILGSIFVGKMWCSTVLPQMGPIVILKCKVKTIMKWMLLTITKLG